MESLRKWIAVQLTLKVWPINGIFFSQRELTWNCRCTQHASLSISLTISLYPLHIFTLFSPLDSNLQSWKQWQFSSDINLNVWQKSNVPLEKWLQCVKRSWSNAFDRAFSHLVCVEERFSVITNAKWNEWMRVKQWSIYFLIYKIKPLVRNAHTAPRFFAHIFCMTM